jgi:hypothetical protein
MRCETCHGLGRLTYDEHPHPKPQQFGSVFPCPDCGGGGVAHCCDGLTACNDAECPDCGGSGWRGHGMGGDTCGRCNGKGIIT